MGKSRLQRNLTGTKRKQDGRGSDTLKELTAKRQKLNMSDSRPPDTKKMLTSNAKKSLKKSPAKARKKSLKLRKQVGMSQQTLDLVSADVADDQTPLKTIVYESYLWDRNSCWLDTSLELIYHAALRNFDDFTVTFRLLPAKTGFQEMYNGFNIRHQKGLLCSSRELSNTRNIFRELLHNERRAMFRQIGHQQPLLVCSI